MRQPVKQFTACCWNRLFLCQEGAGMFILDGFLVTVASIQMNFIFLLYIMFSKGGE